MKKYSVFMFFVCFMICVSISAGKILTEKPDWVQTCVLGEPVPEFTKCSTSSTQALFKQLNTGIEGLDTLETIDPFKIKKINILNGGNGPVSLDASLTNVKIKGFANVVIKENKVSRKDYSWETHLFLPKMRIEGNYRMNGRILVIPLTGNGKCWLEPEKMNIKTYIKVSLYNKEDHVFFNVSTISVDFKMKGLKLQFDNLFEGAKELGDSTNLYLNQNWREVSEAFRPIIAKTIEDVLLDVLRKIFDYMPADWLETCVIADPVPEFTKCSTRAIQSLFKQLNTGIEGLDTLEPIDPFKIKKINILNGGNGPVTLDASLSNVKVTGFGKAVIKENRVARKDYSWDTHLFLPKMRIEGNYRMNGRILVIPLIGNGKCWLEPEKMDIKTHTKVNLVTRDDHVFYNVNTVSVDFTMKGLKLQFDNLFEGAKELEESTNLYLNQNWRDVSEAFRPIIAKTIQDILLDILRQIFDYMPGDFYVSDLPKQ